MELLQTIFDWASDVSTSTAVRTLVALLAIPGAIWGVYQCYLWWIGRSAPERVEALGEQVTALSKRFEGLPELQAQVASLHAAAANTNKRPETTGTLPSTSELRLARALAKAWVVNAVRVRSPIGKDPEFVTALKAVDAEKRQTGSHTIVLTVPCPSINPLAVECDFLLSEAFGQLRKGTLPAFDVKLYNDMFVEAEDLIYAIPHRSISPNIFEPERAIVVAVLDALLKHHPELTTAEPGEAYARRVAARLIHERHVREAIMWFVVQTVMRVKTDRYSENTGPRFPIPKKHPIAPILTRLMHAHIEDAVPQDLSSVFELQYRRLLPDTLPVDLKEHGFQSVFFLEDILAFWKEQGLLRTS